MERPVTTFDDLERVIYLTAATLPPDEVECTICHTVSPWWDVWKRTDGQLVEVCLGCSNHASHLKPQDLRGVASGTLGVTATGPETPEQIKRWAEREREGRELLRSYWKTIPYRRTDGAEVRRDA